MVEQSADSLLPGMMALHPLEHARVPRFDADLDRSQAGGLHAVEQVFVEIIEMRLAHPFDAQPRRTNAVGDLGATGAVEREDRIAKQDALRSEIPHQVLELGNDVGGRALAPLAAG